MKRTSLITLSVLISLPAQAFEDTNLASASSASVRTQAKTITLDKTKSDMEQRLKEAEQRIAALQLENSALRAPPSLASPVNASAPLQSDIVGVDPSSKE